MQKGIVVTSGRFDIFHAGHAKLLEFCKELGEFVIVLLQSDKSIVELTGQVPIFQQELRKHTLEACRYVDNVTIFDGYAPASELTNIKPEIFVQEAPRLQPPGYDESRESVAERQKTFTEAPEQEIVEFYEGNVVFFPIDSEEKIRERVYARLANGDCGEE